MIKRITFSILFFICIAISSCNEINFRSNNSQTNSDSHANSNSIKKQLEETIQSSIAYKSSLAKPDSEKAINKILKSIRDTLPGFKKAYASFVTQDTLTSFVMRDSLNTIAVYLYPNWKIMSVYRSYNQSNLTWEKDYYENGKFKSEGMELTGMDADGFSMAYPGTDLLLGKWTYYSQTGKQDSIVDHDKDFKITYFDALERAEKHGWKKSEIAIDYGWGNGKEIYWRVYYVGEKNPLEFNNLLIEINSGKEEMNNQYYLHVIDANMCKR
jgi:antitoxin component YwqK of YwqJK toxin-antitoxin module